MALLNRKRALFFAILVYLGCVLFSVYVMELRRSSLQFHTRDYNYFIEHAARLADPNLRDRMALNGDGFNLFGMHGSESAIDIFQALHAEWFRYSYTLLYWIFGRPWPLYLFFSAIFFLPVLYAMGIPRSRQRLSYLPVILLILLYVLYPASFPSAVGDLRSRFLFPAAWLLVMLAIVHDRPFREKLAFFLLLLVIREEGILLGAFALLLNLFYTREPAARKQQTLILLALDVLALAAFLLFMEWNGYLSFDPGSIPLPLPDTLKVYLFSRRGLAGLGLLAAAAVALTVLAWRRSPGGARLVLLGAAHALPVLMAGSQVFKELGTWFDNQGGLTTRALANITDFLAIPNTALVAYMLIFLLAQRLERAWDPAGVPPSRRGWTALALVLCAAFLALTLLSFPKEVRRYRQEAAPARLVWQAKAALDPYQTGVLVDYATWQAFYDFNEVIVYNRLPLWIAHPESRYYPANKDILAGVVKERIDAAVIAVESLDEVSEVALMAGFEIEEVARNETYVALRFIVH